MARRSNKPHPTAMKTVLGLAIALFAMDCSGADPIQTWNLNLEKSTYKPALMPVKSLSVTTREVGATQFDGDGTPLDFTGLIVTMTAEQVDGTLISTSDRFGTAIDHTIPDSEGPPYYNTILAPFLGILEIEQVLSRVTRSGLLGASTKGVLDFQTKESRRMLPSTSHFVMNDARPISGLAGCTTITITTKGAAASGRKFEQTFVYHIAQTYATSTEDARYQRVVSGVLTKARDATLRAAAENRPADVAKQPEAAIALQLMRQFGYIPGATVTKGDLAILLRAYRFTLEVEGTVNNLVKEKYGIVDMGVAIKQLRASFSENEIRVLEAELFTEKTSNPTERLILLRDAGLNQGSN